MPQAGPAATLTTTLLLGAEADIAGKVVAVHDGDTVSILTPAKAQVKVRLNGIDAPELKQAFGAKGKAALSALVFGKAVIVHPTGLDLYGRTLGRVEAAGKDVNLQMVSDGFAWHYTRYSKDGALAKRPRPRPKAPSVDCGSIPLRCHRGSSGRPRLGGNAPRRTC